MKFWPWKARNEHPVIDLTNEAVTVPVPEVWEPDISNPKVAFPEDHVRFVVQSLQEANETGFVTAAYICRIYPELCWIANVVPLTKRQLEMALSGELRKAKRKIKRTLVSCYFIPPFGVPTLNALVKMELEMEPKNVVAFKAPVLKQIVPRRAKAREVKKAA